MSDKITIIGIGDDGLEGLTHQANQIISSAGTLLVPGSLQAGLDLQSRNSDTEVRSLSTDLDEVAGMVTDMLSRSEGKPIVMLASGDPLFYGTARFLCDKLGKDQFEVLPHVSSMQLAFARVKESWDEAFLTNLASQDLARVVERIRSAEKVGAFTTNENSPRALAQTLLERGIDYFTAYICENIGAPDECVTRGTLEEIAKQDFADLNVMILVRHPDVPDRPAAMEGRRIFGNPDECFLQSQPKRGLLTQCEVRVIALAEMDIGPNSVVWDVGAGSGSVAIEAAQLAPGGHVYGIEMDPEDYNLLIENSRTFGTNNLTPVLGEAPKAWEELPAPDSIFIGGTGRAVLNISREAWSRLKPNGRLVVQLGSVDNLAALENHLRDAGGEPSVLMVNLSRSQQQLDALRFESANPSFLVVARKVVGS